MAETFELDFASGQEVEDALKLAVTAVQPTDVVIGTGEGQADGLMTHEDKAKLDGIEASADANQLVFHGFEGREGSSLSITDAVVTLAVPTSQVVWLNGVRYELTGDLVLDLGSEPDLGTHYIVAQDDGEGALELTELPSAWSITETSYTPVAAVYWNGSAGAVQEERHGHDRILAQHAYLHKTRGAAIENNGSFSQTRPSTANDGQIELVAGSLWDEDIENEITTAQGKLCRHWYETASGVWTWADGTANSGYDRPFLWNAGTSRVRYPDSGNSYALADVGPTAFYPVWVYASNDVDRPIYVVTPARNSTYPNLASARNATAPVLPFAPELKLLWRWLYRGDGEYQEAADYRTASSLPSGGVSAPVAASVTFTPSGDLAATNVQSALEELDDEKLPKTGGVIGSYRNTVATSVSGNLTTATHSGKHLITSGNVTIPNAAGDVGFTATIQAGGAHTITFNSTTSAALATGDVVTAIVTSTTTIVLRKSAAADQVALT